LQKKPASAGFFFVCANAAMQRACRLLAWTIATSKRRDPQPRERRKNLVETTFFSTAFAPGLGLCDVRLR
jgi:hypothetical protein